jgi:hypothetical protein
MTRYLQRPSKLVIRIPFPVPDWIAIAEADPDLGAKVAKAEAAGNPWGRLRPCPHWGSLFSPSAWETTADAVARPTPPTASAHSYSPAPAVR